MMMMMIIKIIMITIRMLGFIMENQFRNQKKYSSS